LPGGYDAAEAAAVSVHVERVDSALSRLVPPPPPLRSKALLRQKEGGEKFEEGLNAALHKTRPHQGERLQPRRERRWLWPVAPARGPWEKAAAGVRKKGENRIAGRSLECTIKWTIYIELGVYYPDLVE
jgi:hypothetical protein